MMTARYVMDGVSGMEGVEVDASMYADHQRYFFCQAPRDLAVSTTHPSPPSFLHVSSSDPQSISTVGALLLLVAHGPGRLSIDEPHGPPTIVTAKGDQ